MNRGPIAGSSRAALLALLSLPLLLSCAGFGEDVQVQPRPTPLADEPRNETDDYDASELWPRLPSVEGPLWPSMAQVRGEANLDLLADVEFCTECHQDAAAHWQSSAHARSSFDNPWYRAAVDALREDVGPEASRFCAGCHDPLLLLSGKIDQDVVQPDDPMAHAGITCGFCHSVVDTTSDGNGSWVLETSRVPIPIRGDAASIEAHKARMATDPLRTPELCGSCHRVFLTEANGNAHFIPGLDDLGPWRASAHAGSHAERIDEPVEERTCQSCHMPGERTTRGDMAAPRGEISSHRFTGGQTALAALTGDSEQVAAIRQRLESAATIDVAAVRHADGRTSLPADGARVRAGEELALDVVVRNVGTGHRFPGGVRDTQEMWISVEVRTSSGELIAEAGAQQKDREDETAHHLRTVMLDDDGHPELRHRVRRFESAGWDHTVGPRDAAITRYELALPETLEAEDFPLSVAAHLIHRRHVRPMHEAACAATRSARGRAFMETSRALGHPVLDGCAPQPVTELTSAKVWIGRGAEDHPGEGGAARPDWQRLYEHALALTHQLQEHTDEARPSIARALDLLGEERRQERAMVLVALAAIEGRQGRVDDAVAAADRAEALVGSHPAIARVRGDAYAQVWRWERATDAYADVVEVTPRDSSAWRAYARALGSLQKDEESLAAAVTGLELAPRDEFLLRSQALALAGLHRDNADRARELFAAHRLPDRQSELRLRCAREVDLCARDQQPVVTIRMRAH